MTFLTDVLSAMESVSSFDALQYGRKGMKWGVTTRSDGTKVATEVAVKSTPGKKVKTSGGKGRPASEDATKAAISKQVAKKSSTDALSNQELQQLVQRMQLESNFRRLAAEDRSAGQKFISNFLTNKKNRDDYLKAGNAVAETVLAAKVGEDIKKMKL